MFVCVGGEKDCAVKSNKIMKEKLQKGLILYQ